MWFSQSLRSGRKSRETPGQPGSKTCIDSKRGRGEEEGGEEEGKREEKGEDVEERECRREGTKGTGGGVGVGREKKREREKGG